MIKANCRERLTADDFDWVVRTLGASDARRSLSLGSLLVEAETRDAVLDDPALAAALLDGAGTLRISPQLYFYILTRKVMRDTSCRADRAVSDYVASLLEGFSQTARMRSPADGRATFVQYLGDMLLALRTASPQQAFLIRAHMGNYALFLTGVFRELVESRSQRGAPDLGFYEGVGRESFRAAAQHPVARAWDLRPVFEALAECFREVRLALNRLADGLLHLDSGHAPLALSL